MCHVMSRAERRASIAAERQRRAVRLRIIATSLMAGAVVSGRWHLGPEARTFLVVGVLGGYTTFSSFSLDTLTLLKDGHAGLAVWNVVGQIGLSLIGVWAAFRLTAG